MMNRHRENMENYRIFLSDSLKKPFGNVVELRPSLVSEDSGPGSGVFPPSIFIKLACGAKPCLAISWG